MTTKASEDQYKNNDWLIGVVGRLTQGNASKFVIVRPFAYLWADGDATQSLTIPPRFPSGTSHKDERRVAYRRSAFALFRQAVLLETGNAQPVHEVP